jgi:hypothetical protein
LEFWSFEQMASSREPVPPIPLPCGILLAFVGKFQFSLNQVLWPSNTVRQQVMRAFLLLLMFLPVIGFTEQVRLEVGASSAATDEVLRKIAATDITPNMEVVGSKGEWPVYGLYWSVWDFKVILEIASGEKKVGVISICYWTDDDFNVSKMHREDSRRYVRSITFDTEKKTYIVKKKSWWRFWR